MITGSKSPPIFGGGEMGNLIRSYRWSDTQLGPIDVWPTDLLHTLNLMLNSRFPMFLFWGPELTCFYNDGYRPSLGNEGKHPGILGLSAQEAWPEIWEQIGPLISQVLTNREAIWMEDALIPIFRNKVIEKVYWTFSYSPLFDQRGETTGVFVTCMETTEKVENLKIIQEQAKSLTENQQILENITSASPAALWMTDEKGKATYFNQPWITWTGRPIEAHIGDGWFESIYDQDRSDVIEQFNQALLHKKEFKIDFRTVMADGSLLWTLAKGLPLWSDEKQFSGFAGSCLDISDRKRQERQLKKNMGKLEQLVLDRTKTLRRREAQLSQSQELAGMAGWEWYFENEAISWSPEMYRFWGYEVNEITPNLQYVKMNTHPDDHHILTNAIDQIRAGRDIEIEYRRFNKRGEIIYILTKARAIQDELGRTIGVYGTDLDTTKKKETENHLIKLNQELTTAYEIGKIGMWKVDFEKNLYEWSDNLYRIYGFQPGEIELDTSSYGNVHPDDRAIIIRSHQKIRQDGKPVEFEFRRINKQGEIINIISKGKVDKNVDGKVTAIRGICINVTELRKKEQELLDSEQFTKSILEILPNIIYIYDLQKEEYIFSNRNVFEFLGYSDSDIDQYGTRALYPLLHPDDHDIVQQHFDSFVSREADDVLQCEYRCKTHEGKYRNILARDAVYRKDPDGRVIQVIGMLIDITNTKVVALQLEAANKLLSSKNQVLEQQLLREFSESFASYHTGTDFFNSLSSELALKTKLDYILFGRIVIQENGHPIIASFSFRHRNELKDRIAFEADNNPFDTILRGYPFSCPENAQLTLTDQKGAFHLKADGVIAHPLFDERRKVIGVICVLDENAIQNVSYTDSLIRIASKRIEMELSRISNEEELERKNLRLERQNQDLVSFNRVVSHDLQEPIRKIQMFISRINSQSSLLSDQINQYLSRTEDAARRMQQLILDLLAFSSLNQNGDLFEKVNLADLMQECIAELSEQIKSKDAQIKFDNLPEIKGVPFQLRQLIDNLLANSLKYSKDAIRPKIEIKSRILDKSDPAYRHLLNPKRKYLLISISDNGIGFDQKYASEIFLPFKRLHTRDTYPGTGIGLATCKKIVENHQGLIAAESRLGQGSTFLIYLPAKLTFQPNGDDMLKFQ
ncbi:MAG: PAS domain-containing protein [Saprospiraceae bacterium]|nr:PAS domain-containing protein [Saprospiraceae bacterium]